MISPLFYNFLIQKHLKYGNNINYTIFKLNKNEIFEYR